MLQALSLVLPICVQTSICHQSTHLCRQIKYSTVMQWGFCAGTGSSPDQIINYRRLWRVPPSVSEWPGGVPLTADLIAFFGLWVSGRSPLSQHPLSGFLRVYFRPLCLRSPSRFRFYENLYAQRQGEKKLH